MTSWAARACDCGADDCAADERRSTPRQRSATTTAHTTSRRCCSASAPARARASTCETRGARARAACWARNARPSRSQRARPRLAEATSHNAPSWPRSNAAQCGARWQRMLEALSGITGEHLPHGALHRARTRSRAPWLESTPPPRQEDLRSEHPSCPLARPPKDRVPPTTLVFSSCSHTALARKNPPRSPQ